MVKVSIIIPVYNVALYIEKSLLSALNQTYSNIEYVIVDDCGKDDSMLIVNSIKNKFSEKEIKIVHHQQNRGLSAARNTGVMNASGEYIYIMDSDDTISRDCIQMHVDAIQKYDADYTDANIQVIGGRKSLFRKIKTEALIENKQILISSFLGDIHIPAWNKLYKKEFITKNNIQSVEGLIHEDNVWTFDVAKNASKVVSIPDITYHYYIRESSITTSVSVENIIKRYNSWVYILNYIAQLAQSMSDKESLRSLSMWMSKTRFKISAKLISIDIDESIKIKYYKEINSNNLKMYSSGLYSLLCSMSYSKFKKIFTPLYKVFTKIKNNI